MSNKGRKTGFLGFGQRRQRTLLQGMGRMCVAVVVLLAAGATDAQSDVLVLAWYPMTDGTSRTRASQDTEPNTTASSIADVGWTGNLRNKNNPSRTEIEWNSVLTVLRKDIGVNQAPADNKYWTFTITPASGAKFSISSISYRVANEGTSNAYATLFTSVRGFDDSTDQLNRSGNLRTYNTDGTFRSVSVNLSSNANYQDLTGPVEVRIYMDGNAATHASQVSLIDEIVVEGSVVPAPASPQGTVITIK